ncbi:hypothetical protein CCR95_23610 [Thiocystis minor]|uniref:PAS domain S-box protein n=1 Tax=Thiocystis minor TaxID=61597 RepID=UPI001911BE58|nr:PAS domain S-box protein [Thiocystis minor]MBK5966972.1 hypothetical protein [Thiocystis minor]
MPHSHDPSQALPPNEPDKSGHDLRQQAEARVGTLGTTEREALTPEATERLVHELQVHQIELALQNEELRHAQAALEASQARYFDLYDLAPVGYLTLNDAGRIQEANLAAANLLEIPRRQLIGQPLSGFIWPGDQDILYHVRRQLWSTGERQDDELRLRRADGVTCWVHLQTSLAPEGSTAADARWRVILTDITARHRIATELARSEQQTQSLLRENLALLDNAFVGIFFVQERHVIRANRFTETLFGYAPGALNGVSTEVFYPDRAAYLALGQRAYPAIHRGESFVCEVELVRRDGQRFWCLMRAQALTPEQPLDGSLWILEDATERRAARQAQKQAAELYRAIFESRDVIKVLIDPDDGHILDANQAAAAFYGFPREVLRQRYAWEQNASTPREALLALFADFKARRMDGTDEHETLHRRASGEVCPVGIHLDVIHRDTQPLLLATVLDLTARKTAEAALRDSEARYRSALLALAEGIAVYDRQGVLITSNPAAERILGLIASDYQARSVDDGIWWIIHPDGTPFSSDDWPSVATLSSGIAQRDVEMGVVGSDHRVTWLLVNSEPIRDTVSGDIQAVAVSFTDISARKAAEAALQQSEARFRTLFTDARVIMLLIDPGTGEIVDANTAAADYYGYHIEQLRGLPISAINTLTPEQIALEMRQAAGKQSWHFQFGHRLANGEVRDVEVYSGPLELEGRSLLFSIVHDITERRRAEAAVRVSLDEIQRRNAQIMALNRLNELLLSCDTRAEAYATIARGAEPLFVGCSGGLAMLDEAGTAHLRVVATWGDPSVLPATFPLDDCWGMRRGDCHTVTAEARSLHCRHLGHPPPSAAICVPLSVRSETLGLLHLGTDTRALQELQPIVMAVGETIKLALSNIKLQETLREQAIRDRLTGLYNRRYLDEILPRELQRSQRRGESLAVAMLDVDHFKGFNDRYGHEAGDAVLGAIGALLNRSLRAGDLACRYGGEELTVVLPGASLEEAGACLENLRTAILQLRVPYQDGDLPAITVSIGVTVLGEEPPDAAALLARADAALYRAKADGRNRVIVANA